MKQRDDNSCTFTMFSTLTEVPSAKHAHTQKRQWHVLHLRATQRTAEDKGDRTIFGGIQRDWVETNSICHCLAETLLLDFPRDLNFASQYPCTVWKSFVGHDDVPCVQCGMEISMSLFVFGVWGGGGGRGYLIIPCGRFGAPYLSKTTSWLQQQRNCPFLPVCRSFVCLNNAGMDVLISAYCMGFFNMHTARCWFIRWHTEAVRIS